MGLQWTALLSRINVHSASIHQENQFISVSFFQCTTGYMDGEYSPCWLSTFLSVITFCAFSVNTGMGFQFNSPLDWRIWIQGGGINHLLTIYPGDMIKKKADRSDDMEMSNSCDLMGKECQKVIHQINVLYMYYISIYVYMIYSIHHIYVYTAIQTINTQSSSASLFKLCKSE